MEFPRSIPYGSPALAPFWGPQTSAVNFCEEDYVITHYIGEFFNTLTSLIYVGYGYLGIVRRRSSNVGAFDAVNFPYWALMGVGICSAGYHMTLKYHTQMSDELSMHLAMGTVLHRIYTYEQPLEVQRRNTAIILGILVPFVIYHCVTDEFVLHVILFLGMCILVTIKTKQMVAARDASAAQRQTLSNLSTFSAASSAFGYFLWNIDVNFCSVLTAWKRQLGLPWAAVLELHGWWHFFTALGAYTVMALIEFLLTSKGDASDGKGFLWPASRVLPGLATTVRAVSGQPAKTRKDE